jgi:hypothetical protein
MASTDPLDIAKRLLRNDKRFVKFRDLVAADSALRLPIDEWRQEARLLFGSRTVKKLSGSSPNFARKLVKAQAMETAARGRFTEMLVQTNTVHRKLKQHIEALTDWLTVEYSYEVAQVCKTAKEREALIANTMRVYIKLMDDTENFLQELNFYIKDIDQAGYGIRAMADVFGAIFKAEGRVDL